MVDYWLLVRAGQGNCIEFVTYFCMAFESLGLHGLRFASLSLLAGLCVALGIRIGGWGCGWHDELVLFGL